MYSKMPNMKTGIKERMRKLQVRLPVDLIAEYEAEALESGIPVSTLIRRDAMRGRRMGGVAMNSGESTEKMSEEAKPMT